MSTLPPLKIIYAGTPDFAAVALQALIDSRHQLIAVYTQPDRPAGRGRKLKPSPVKSLAMDHHIPVYQPESLKEPAEQLALAALDADLMVVAAYGLLLPEAVLTTPPLGCLNIHASLLPRWRGAAPIQRAILAGDSETGVTIMQMDMGLDTGDMLYKLATPIVAGESSQPLHDRLAAIGAEALLTTLDQLQHGEAHPEPQDESQANYARKLTKEEATIDWQQSAAQIARQVAAFNPWPVAQTRYQTETLRIWEALPIASNDTAAAGQVIAATKSGIDVACGEGVLRIGRLQLPGGRPLTAVEFINGRTLVNERLGEAN